MEGFDFDFKKEKEEEFETRLELKVIDNIEGEEFETLNNWFYHWWGKKYGRSEEYVKEYLRRNVLAKSNGNSNNTFGVPEVYGIFQDGILVATFSFTMCDTEERTDLYPWLADVYVDEEYRGLGISRFLIKSAIKKAKEKGLKCLYCYTAHDSLYEKYGFKFVELIKTEDEENFYERLYKIDLN